MSILPALKGHRLVSSVGALSIVCYVDDCTYGKGETDPVVLSENLTTQYKVISDFMAANHLVINAAENYNRVPGHIRASRTLATFKTKLKQWVSTNIPID